MAETFILFFQSPQVLVVYTAIQNKDYVSQPPMQPEEAGWLVLAGRLCVEGLFGSFQDPLPFLYSFSHPLHADSYDDQSSDHHVGPWEQGPYSEDVGTVI